MRTYWRKILAVILSIGILVTAMPATAFADETAGEIAEEENGSVASLPDILPSEDEDTEIFAAGSGYEEENGEAGEESVPDELTEAGDEEAETEETPAEETEEETPGSEPGADCGDPNENEESGFLSASDRMVRAAVRALKPVIARLPEKERASAADAALRAMRSLPKGEKSPRSAYAALAGAARAEDPADLGKRIISSRNINYRR